MTETTRDAGETNRGLRNAGVLIVVASIAMAWWLATSVGDLVTAAWMMLFLAVGVTFISLARHPDPGG
ncbi:MAG: hypothetical protein ABEJ77_02580 [Halanaeroarchaeum sp.]